MRKSWKSSRRLAVGIAMALGCSMASVAFADEAIVADSGVTTEKSYSSALDIIAEDNMIEGGPWLPNIGSAVSASGEGTVLNLNLGSNALTVDGEGSSHSTGITAINKGVININSKGSMSVEANSDGGGQTAALFVNGGGKIIVNNDKNVLKLTGYTTRSTNGAVVKAMNGVKDTRSYINIKGLVDITADTTDGEGMSEAVSAVASTIDIGGGKIFATKKGVNPGLNYGFAENCAIRAYGEFVSSNYGIVNVNVIKDGKALDAKAIGAGKNDVQILGDFNTVGGMGTKGIINVGLNTKDSYWNGNYIKGAGWGETPGDYGSVNLFMGDGAQWVGNASFATNVKMTDENTAWKGYSLNNAVSAEITNGAAWHNYNTENTTALRALTGSDSFDNVGFVYMTPFSKTVDGTDVNNTGDVNVANFAGHMKVVYAHDGENIIGGNFTVNNAEENSAIRLVTDNTSIDTNNDTVVTNIFNNLAEKLYYTGYVDGEVNLDATVAIAEGLTATGVEKRLGQLAFDYNGHAILDSLLDGTQGVQVFALQRSTAFLDSSEEAKTVYDAPINGYNENTGADQFYVDNGVFDTTSATYNFNEKNNQINATNNYVNASATATTNAYAAISAERHSKTTIDLHDNNLEINSSANDKTYQTIGILATGNASDESKGNVEIKNAGAITINANTSKGGIAKGIKAAGQVLIHNGGDNLENKILKITATAKGGSGGTGVDVSGTMANDPKLIIDGLVDIQNMTIAVGVDSGTFEAAGGKFSAKSQAFNVLKSSGMHDSVVNVNVVKDENGNVIKNNENLVQIDGGIKLQNTSGTAQVNIGLYGAEGYLNGDITGSCVTGEVNADGNVNKGVNLFMDQGAQWTGNIATTVPLALRMHNASVWEGGSSSTVASTSRPLSLTIDTGSVWKFNGNNIGIKYFTGGQTEAERGYVDATNEKAGNIEIDNYAGNTVFIYNRDSEYPTRVLGGNITIGSAAEGSVITLSTDNDGLDTSNAEEVTKVMNKLADKLTYTGAIEGAENNLDGYVQIAEGLTSSSAALKLGSIDFSAEDGKGSLKEGSIVTPDGQKNSGVIYGDKETAMMKGAKTAMASSALMWRAENNDLMKRMGDLRLAEGESGIWAKYYGGKYSMDGQNTDLSVKYNAYQVGYDREIGHGWLAGVALSYNDGDSTYGSGRADLKGTSLGLYGTWKGDDGQYLDLIAKYSRLENEFDVRNAYGHKLSGDYKTWGASLSAEYGKRFEMNKGFYVDPSVELTLGRIAAKDYTASSDYLDSWGRDRSLSVEQDAFTSFIGRVGVRLGQKTDTASYFVKLAAAHEFSGDFDTSFRAAGEADGRTSIDLGDTWCEAQVGLTAKLSDNNTFYASYERSFGGDVEQKYRLDAGLRWSF